MKKLVISGINLIDGGALSVFHDCLDSLVSSEYLNEYEVIILVGNRELFKKYESKVTVMEFSKSKRSWVLRLFYEYFYFRRLSKRLSVDVWFSLHDITPNVIARKKYVYCHNPSPFNKMAVTEAKYGVKYYLFSKFYKYLYKINIKNNDAIIVQQNWIREEFSKMFHHSNIIVARPSIPPIRNSIATCTSDKNIFVFPSYPRYYKNFQIACEASKILQQKGINNYSLIVTVDGSENLYAKELVEEYSSIPEIKFSGLLSRAELFDVYDKAKCLIFMSKLETWGMPLIEFKNTNKSIITVDMPYAHETIGDYKKVAFVNADDADRLAQLMEVVIHGGEMNEGNQYIEPKKPYAQDWSGLLQILLG